MEENKEWLPDKSLFKDAQGRFKTQSLFLEVTYDSENAVYTFKDYDFEYEGKLFKSLHKLFVESEDPSEYEFANKYLYNWDHWQRIVANKLLNEQIREWREELEVRMRAKGVRAVIELSKGNFSAAKWVADGHWSARRGRPSKEEQNRERKIRERAVEEATSDSDRLIAFRKPANAESNSA